MDDTTDGGGGRQTDPTTWPDQHQESALPTQLAMPKGQSMSDDILLPSLMSPHRPLAVTVPAAAYMAQQQSDPANNGLQQHLNYQLVSLPNGQTTLQAINQPVSFLMRCSTSL